MSGGQDEAARQIESSGEAIACPHCSETLDYSERGRNWLCERCGILWSATGPHAGKPVARKVV